MLFISTKYPKKFNAYLVCKIKEDLKNHALFFNPLFYYRGKEYSVKKCIDSLVYCNNKIYFKLDYQIKHLIYNNRQLYWLDTIKKYQKNIGVEYFYWLSRKNKNKGL